MLVSVNCDLIKHKNNKIIDLEGLKSIGEISNIIGEETLIIVETTVPPEHVKKLSFLFSKKHLKIEILILQNYTLPTLMKE